MRVISLSVVVAILSVLSSCAKAEYLIPGLTLPAGSTVVNKTLSTSQTSGGGSSLPFQIPGVTDKKRGESLMVAFNNSSGYSAVAAHINGCLIGKGFSDDSAMMNMGAGAFGGGELAKMLGSMKMWENQKTGYAVILEDLRGILGKGFAKLQGGAGATAGQYTLMIYKTK